MYHREEQIRKTNFKEKKNTRNHPKFLKDKFVDSGSSIDLKKD